MIDTTDLKKGTCRIKTIADYGTGVFVRIDLILTSYHVVKSNLTEGFKVINHDGKEIDVFVLDYSIENDLAILQTKSEKLLDVVTLCNEAPVLGTEWATHGHPKTPEGFSVGSKLDGKVKDLLIIDHEHDIVLDSGSTPITAECRGYSGSGVINARSQVTSILRYRDNNAFCSVSIRKAESFLRKHGILIIEDELLDFSVYKPQAFQTIANPLKDICTAHSEIVVKNSAPQTIAKELVGNIFFPKHEESLTDIIAYLKQNININNSLWVGWLEFLAYVQMLKGTYTNINAIYIELKGAEISKLVDGVETKIVQDLGLTLQFYFTEEKEYFTIARKFLLDKQTDGKLENFKCQIFHSELPRFGQQPFTAEDKKNIIFNIADPADAGFQVVGDTYFGVLSFNELSAKVAVSKSLAETTKNLKQIFLDAIAIN